jgi:hypothetical protein
MMGDRSGEALLQSLMQDICLRRRKDMKFVDLKLPKKTEYLHRITFHPEEQAKYDALLYVNYIFFCLLVYGFGTNSLVDQRPGACWRNTKPDRKLDRRAASKTSWSAFFGFDSRKSPAHSLMLLADVL